MGGIIGKLSFQHDETLALPVLEQMLGALRHRGAHGSGIYTAPGIALGWCGENPAPINRPVVATNEPGTVHVIADAPPAAGFAPVEATLEDVYFAAIAGRHPDAPPVAAPERETA